MPLLEAKIAFWTRSVFSAVLYIIYTKRSGIRQLGLGNGMGGRGEAGATALGSALSTRMFTNSSQTALILVDLPKSSKAWIS